MRRWIDLLSEAPITITTHDFERGGGDMYNSFEPADRKLMQNTKAVAKIQKRWETSVVDLNLFLLNTDRSPGGQLGLSYFDDERMSLEAKAVEAGFELDPNAINCILSNNYSGEVGIPLTAWMIGHRLWHAITSKEKTFYFDSWGTLESSLSKIGNAYTCGSGLVIAHALGRSRACREKILTNFNELLPETFAEYLLFGKVRLNRLPDVIVDGVSKYHIREDNYGGRHWRDIAKEHCEELERELNRHHAELIQHAIGNAYTF